MKARLDSERCNKEVQARKGAIRWVSCKRKACTHVPSKHVAGMTMHYCAKHAPKAGAKQ